MQIWSIFSLFFILELNVCTSKDVLTSCIVPRNKDYKLLSLNSNTNTTLFAQQICSENQMALFNCGQVFHAIDMGMKDIISYNITNAIVNVTLDHSIPLNISIPSSDLTTSIIRNVILFPEEPISIPKTKFCEKHKLTSHLCENLDVVLRKQAKQIWGCHLSEENNHDQIFEGRSKHEEIVNGGRIKQATVSLSVTIDGKVNVIEYDRFLSPALKIAKLCRLHPHLSIENCYKIYDRSLRLSNTSIEPIFSRSSPLSNRQEELQVSDPVILSPKPNYYYPITQRVYVEISAYFENHIVENNSSRICMFLDQKQDKIYCGLQSSNPVYIQPYGINAGSHMLLIAREELSSDILQTNYTFLDAVFFQVTIPSIEFQKIEYISNKISAPHISIHLMVKSFILTNESGKLCILLDNEIMCVNPNSSIVKQRSKHHNGEIVVPIYGLRSGQHLISFFLMNEFEKCVYMSDGITFTVPKEDDQISSTLPRISDAFFVDQFTAKKMNKCMMALSSVGSWVCRLVAHEWGFFSQNGEDGILEYIFKNIGTVNKYFVEFGVENGMECNTRFLRQYRNWTGLMMDGGNENLSINLRKEWISVDNVNRLFEKYAVPQEFDLLSIDIDFNDFWVMKAIDEKIFSPRVIVVEYNSHLPPHESKTVKYSEDGWDGKSNYFGASLMALTKLAIRKQYSLVYCESHGVNCFYVRNDVLGFNTLDFVDIVDIYTKTNFFGKGWTYPNTSLEKNKWEWI